MTADSMLILFIVSSVCFIRGVTGRGSWLVNYAQIRAA
jgi:hypothetical protein